MFSSLANSAQIANFADGCRRAIARLKLAKQGISVSKRDHYGGTALHTAAFYGGLDEISLLLTAGADVNAVDVDGNTPLHKLLNGHILPEDHAKICRLMVEHGADVNAGNHFTRRPLLNAVDKGAINLCRLLLDSGADPNADWVIGSLEFPSECALHRAAEKGRIDLCRLLLERGASSSWSRENNTNAEFLTPFQHVVKHGPVEMVRFFVEECGESLSQRTFNGRTLVEVSKDGSPEMAYLLSRETEQAIQDALPAEEEVGNRATPRRSIGMAPL